MKHREEIDHRTIKLIVGVIALSLATLTNLFARAPLTSISASYHEGGWSQSIFVGFLFAIAAFLLAYNGRTDNEMRWSKVAAFAGLVVALFPCECGTNFKALPFIHFGSAAVMFLILVYFCYGFFKRARDKHYPQAQLRAGVYAVCGVLIVLAILVLAADGITDNALQRRIPRLTFYGEATGLIAFGVSWLTASRVLPVVTRPNERFSPLRKENPA